MLDLGHGKSERQIRSGATVDREHRGGLAPAIPIRSGFRASGLQEQRLGHRLVVVHRQLEPRGVRYEFIEFDIFSAKRG